MTEWRKQFYSGICLCGHSWKVHHLCTIFNQDYIKEVGEGSMADQCLAFGHNETAGLDENGNDHCHGYVDKDDPDPEVRAKWWGTTRQAN